MKVSATDSPDAASVTAGDLAEHLLAADRWAVDRDRANGVPMAVGEETKRAGNGRTSPSRHLTGRFVVEPEAGERPLAMAPWNPAFEERRERLEAVDYAVPGTTRCSTNRRPDAARCVAARWTAL